MPRKYGFSFSWKRALGLSATKQRIARKTGIPLTRSGVERKVGRTVMSGCSVHALLPFLVLVGTVVTLLRRLR